MLHKCIWRTFGQQMSVPHETNLQKRWEATTVANWDQVWLYELIKKMLNQVMRSLNSHLVAYFCGQWVTHALQEWWIDQTRLQKSFLSRWWMFILNLGSAHTNEPRVVRLVFFFDSLLHRAASAWHQNNLRPHFSLKWKSLHAQVCRNVEPTQMSWSVHAVLWAMWDI